MSLANLGRQLEDWRNLLAAALTRASMAEDQQNDYDELLAQWFIDSDEGARDFLREIARMHRERLANQRTVKVTLIYGTRVADPMGSP